VDAAVLIGVAVAIWTTYRVVRYILKERYFGGEDFLAHRERIAAVVAEHNEVGQYIAEIRSRGLFAIGASDSGAQAHLTSFENTSHWNYRRDRNLATYNRPNVHNCSLQVARNASADPLKYLMKYFNIRADEPTLREVERLSESISRLEEAVSNLHAREARITESVNPPRFIVKHYLNEFMSKVGVELSPITVPYPVYVFEYVSAGGNSSQRTPITLNTPVIDALIETLGQKIRWRKSAAGQRALMTAKLRDAIKLRDGHTCQQCSLSLAAEPNLLLEVDHIIPVSRGGLSHPDNLQTLCWRCNRSKSNKMPTGRTTANQVPPAAAAQVAASPVVQARQDSAPQSTSEDDPRLKQLSQLLDSGVITADEFAAAKSRL
jgi:5-methylcytosine-specific restriction endonuclease McrA